MPVLHVKLHGLIRTGGRQPATEPVEKHLLGLGCMQRVETGLLHECIRDYSDPRIVKRVNATGIQDLDTFDLGPPGLRKTREARRMQAHIDVNRDCVFVFAARRRDGRIHHCDNRQFDFRRDTKKQAEIARTHIWRHGDDEVLVCGCQRAPHLLELTACQVRSAQVPKSLIAERCRYEVRPVGVLNSSRHYSCCRVRLVARRKSVVVEQREAGLAI